jgi:redox-sensitive bicupin YhaK (pirin superfamily)
MSKRAETVAAEECMALGAVERQLDVYPNRDITLGTLTVARALPIKDRRLVGPWCFLDRFGPLTFSEGKPMDVAPHPHIGLQTVTWLYDGEVVHDDSLGFESVLRPGGVNVMTAGGGIAHAEQTPPDNTGRLDGVQLWTALPEQHRHMPAGFSHVQGVPAIEYPSGIIRVFAGELEGAASPAPYYSAILGADVQVHPRHRLMLPLTPAYEHAVLLVSGDCSLDGQPLEQRMLYYLGSARADACFASRDGGRVLLIGGPPFPETILMWWNFVARTQDEIMQARADWEDRRRFGEVNAYSGSRLAAPPLARLARPNPMS